MNNTKMKEYIVIDHRLKSKIESLFIIGECYMIKFKDLEDTFFFDTYSGLQEFVNTQDVKGFTIKKKRLF